MIICMRLLCAAAAPFCLAAAWGAELLRFTALLQATVVFTVWWLVIVPLLALMEKDPTKRSMFWKWNFSFALINVHCFNLPVAAVDFLYDPRAITAMDLWIVFMAAFGYIIFYTTFLDRRGIFLYFLFTPRTHWCWLVYSLMLGLMCGLLWIWARLGGVGVAMQWTGSAASSL